MTAENTTGHAVSVDLQRSPGPASHEGPVCSASIPMLEESAGAAPAAVAMGGDPLRGGRCAEYDYGKRCLSSSRQRWGT